MGLRAIYECDNCKVQISAGDMPRIPGDYAKPPVAPWVQMFRKEDSDPRTEMLTYCSLKCVAEAGAKEAL